MAIDLAEITPWWDVAWRLRFNEHPSAQELAALTREYGVPDFMRDYMARRLLGQEPARGRGRPRATRRQQERRWWRVVELTHRVRDEQEKNRARGKRSPKELAIRTIATRVNMSPSSLLWLLKNGLRDAPADFVRAARSGVGENTE